MSKSLVMIGSGGHACVLMDLIEQLELPPVVAYVSPDVSFNNQVFNGITHLRHDDDISRFSPDDVLLVNGVGSLPNQAHRQKLCQFYHQLGYQFATIISPNSIVSKSAILAQGVQVMNNVVIQANTRVNAHTIVNTGAIVEHDCDIGANNHLAPRATICGNVTTGAGVHIGTSATVIQGITIEQNVIVGAGATVTHNIEQNSIVYGFRSQVVNRTQQHE
ncbi:acetyltransferase [Shewanella gaetbuli]|uniref:Acetyltransferase n=1 Tax=Shewanella gaetbuli TaxID=220752 RepID=A0A9X2CFU9_9GAMM|nr:acetyltransferase [Shewanella gaetbuli]MCL1141723.1 acetyltransferase [Shewanella gaetbuli]